MVRKLNFIQRLFATHYLNSKKHLLERALLNHRYVIVKLYSQKYKFSVIVEEVEEWISELTRIGYYLSVVNNVIFIW